MIPACLSDDWILCPEREDISAEFTRLLTAAQDGGATIAECLMIARQLKRGDDQSWHREWKKLAQTNRHRAEAAFAEGHRATAQRNWLRAMNYYSAAAMPLDQADERRWVAVLAMQDCARRFLAARDPAGEVVTIPWLDGHSLQGYFLPAHAPLERVRAPTVICIGEPGHRKEEFLFKLAPHARERGFSLLALDLFGDQRDDYLDALLRRRDLESAIPCVMDYLETCSEVDFERVAIVADGWGSSFVARAVLQEPRACRRRLRWRPVGPARAGLLCQPIRDERRQHRPGAARSADGLQRRLSGADHARRGRLAQGRSGASDRPDLPARQFGCHVEGVHRGRNRRGAGPCGQSEPCQ
ncbi:hypothetical protein ACVWZK_005152 [Bradyrhizobium sp. GM0.4]